MGARLFVAFAASGALAIAGCGGPSPEAVADAIYTGGDIVTVNDAQPSAGAVAVKDGKTIYRAQ